MSAAEPAESAPDDLLTDVEQLIAVLTSHPDPEVGVTTTALLEAVDVVHRTALCRRDDHV